MKVRVRRSNHSDLDTIYDLQRLCFKESDCWYKSIIRNYLDSGIVVEIKDTNLIIGVLLQGGIIPCNDKINTDNNDTNYSEDIFKPVNEFGSVFLSNNDHKKEHHGIVMLCIHPNYRGKGLGKVLIGKHLSDNEGKLVCLNTRRSNINAYSLYKKMGYEHIAFIKNKYFLPTEDSIFMVRKI